MSPIEDKWAHLERNASLSHLIEHLLVCPLRDNRRLFLSWGWEVSEVALEELREARNELSQAQEERRTAPPSQGSHWPSGSEGVCQSKGVIGCFSMQFGFILV